MAEEKQFNPRLTQNKALRALEVCCFPMAGGVFEDHEGVEAAVSQDDGDGGACEHDLWRLRARLSGAKHKEAEPSHLTEWMKPHTLDKILYICIKYGGI